MILFIGWTLCKLCSFIQSGSLHGIDIITSQHLTDREIVLVCETVHCLFFENKSYNMSTILVASTLEDVSETNKWYQFQLPGIQEISPRLGHAILYDEREGNCFLVGGGHHDGALNDAWKISLREVSKAEDGAGDATSRVKKLPAMEGLRPKYEFVAVKVKDGDSSERIWMFGGADQKSTFKDIGFIEDGMWIEACTKSEGPSARTQGGNSALIEIEGKSYLCVFAGGQAGVDAVPDGKLYLFSTEEQEWSTAEVIHATPPVTQGHVLVSFGSLVFVYGGLSGTSLHEKMYMIDVAGAVASPQKPCSWTPVEIVSEKFPAARAAHAVATSTTGKKFYIFGGLGQAGCEGDLWEFDAGGKVWRLLQEGKNDPSPGPKARFGAAMVYVYVPEMKTSFLVLHGGMNTEGEIFNDLWVRKLDSS